jgi:energy-coupling factor transporter transmembrane protein EcfT
MKHNKQQNRHKRHKVLVVIAALIIAAILYHWIHLWGIVILGAGLFSIWKYTKLPHKTKLVASLLFSVVFIFAAFSWNSYNTAPKINFDNGGSDYTDNNLSSYTVTGNIASHRSVKLTIDGKPVTLNSAHNFSYKVTNLTVGDNNYTLVATNGSGEDREVLTIHRDTKAEDAANNSPASTTPAPKPATQTPAVSMSTLNAGAVAVFTPELTDLSNQMTTGQTDASQVGASDYGSSFNTWSQNEKDSQNVTNNNNVTKAYNTADNAYYNAHQTAPSALDSWNTDAGDVVSDITKWADAQETVFGDQVSGTDPSSDQQTVKTDYQQYQTDLAMAQADVRQL